MANTQNGHPVNFGIVGLAITNFGATSGVFFLPQDSDFELTRDLDEVRDGTGAKVQRTWYNPEQTATLTYVVAAATSLATAITNTILPDRGSFIAITACTSNPNLVQSTWEVHKAMLKTTNTKAAVVTLNLVFNANITAASGA
jgi:hypothetical protein